MLAQLSTRATDFATELTFNISQYINVTTNTYDVNLLSSLSERYNISTEEVFQTLTALNLTNTTLAHVPPPRGIAGWLILSGLAILALRTTIVRWQASLFVKQFGHAHHDHSE